jgi:hypothetical protein
LLLTHRPHHIAGCDMLEAKVSNDRVGLRPLPSTRRTQQQYVQSPLRVAGIECQVSSVRYGIADTRPPTFDTYRMNPS